MTLLRINCDLGEGFGAWSMGNDGDIMPLIDSANIACGFHAGDPTIMRETVRLARKHRVEIGAHVAYPDLQGFGRRSMMIRGQALLDLVHYQIAALDGIARLQGGRVSYVKPHGALYNDMTGDRQLLADVIRAVAAWPRAIDLVVMARPDNTQAVALARHHGVSLRFEAFADRAYTDAGHLVPRSKKDSVLDPERAAVQARSIVDGNLRSQRGRRIKLQADTLCVHGDSPGAMTMLQSLRAVLQDQ